MSLHFLIDGYNVIKQADFLKDLPNLRCARMSLVKTIQARRLTGSRNNQVTVVFDGRADFNFNQHQRKDQIKTVFSSDESADETIKRIVGESGNPKQIVVVTDDKAIAYFIRSNGARAMSVLDFLSRDKRQQTRKARPKHPGLRGQELAKAELTYQQQEAINQELNSIWK
jgi:predicted RNA-binding protein with PIN domain